ncbi:helix-turn-helix domain-containing protein [Eggerthella lenta]|nr:helix-turn-helix transcriptional regulator [Eggerthella lenta]
MGEEAKALRRSRVIAICGMAAIWPSVHNMLLYPIVFTYFKTGDTATYSFHLIYSVLLVCVTVLLIATRKRMSRRLFASRTLVPLFGVLGSMGIVLVSQLNFSNAYTILLLGVGVSFVALYVPIHFMFWGMQLSAQKGKHAALDTALSIVLFSVLTGLQYAAGIHSIGASIVYPLASAGLAFLALPSGGVHVPENENLRLQPFGLLAPCIAFTLISQAFIVLFNSMSELAMQPPDKELLYFVDAAVFAIIALIFIRDEKSPLVKAFALISVFLVGAISVACFISARVLSAGTVPMIAVKIAFEGLTFIVILDTCNRMRLNPLVPVALFFLLTIAQRFVSACIMYQGSYLSVAPNLTTLFALATATAFAVSAVVALCLIRFLSRTEAQPQPLAAAKVSMPTEDASLTRALGAMKTTFELSDREIEIMQFAYRNANAKQISEALFIAEGTVYSHFKRIYRKVDVHSKKELIAMVNEFKRR